MKYKPYAFTIIVFIGLLLLGMWPVPSKALLRVCNQTRETISLAIGYEDSALMISEGWWTLKPQVCETVINGNLGRERYFLYAIDKQGNEWRGASNLCIDMLKFIINGVEACENQGFIKVGFLEVKRNNLPSQIIQLTEPSTE